MSTERQRVLMAAVRKVVFAGLILLVVWLILLALRGAIPSSAIDQINQQSSNPVSYNSAAWDWSRSLATGNPVSQAINPRLSLTMQLIGLTGLFSLVIAAIFLIIGFFIRRFTERPRWLARLRSIVRSVLVSFSSSALVLTLGPLSIGFMLLFNHFGWLWWMPENAPALIYLTALCASLLPAGLLIQAGHGEIAEWPEKTRFLTLAYHQVIKMIIRLFRMIGIIIVITLPIGLGELLINSTFMRDFPVVFGIAWIFVMMVVLVKMVAELLEIAYNYKYKPVLSAEEVKKESPLQFAIPKGWLIFSLALVALIILLAIIGPLLAPYGMNEIHLVDRLSPPSAKYLLGTDQLGRDILSRMLYAIRTDVLIGLGCAVVLSIIAAGWEILAAYCRKMNNRLGDTLEDVVMLPREIMCAFPWLVLLLLLMSLMADTSIILVAVIAGVVMAPHAIGMIQEGYRSAPNGTDWLQSVLKAIPVIFIFTTAGVIIYVSALSYLGAGVPPGTSELRSMLSDEGRKYIEQNPWIAIWPGLCLTFIITVFVMTGDALLERRGFRSKAFWSKTME